MALNWMENWIGKPVKKVWGAKRDPAEILGSQVERLQPFVEGLLDKPMDIAGKLGEKTIEPIAKFAGKNAPKAAKAMATVAKFAGKNAPKAAKAMATVAKFGARGAKKTVSAPYRLGKKIITAPFNYFKGAPNWEKGLTGLNLAMSMRHPIQSGLAGLTGGFLGPLAAQGIQKLGAGIGQQYPLVGKGLQFIGGMTPNQWGQVGAGIYNIGEFAGVPNIPRMGINALGSTQRALESVPYLGKLARWGTLPGIMGAASWGANQQQTDPLSAVMDQQNKDFYNRVLPSALRGYDPKSSAYRQREMQLINQHEESMAARRQQYSQNQQQLDLSRQGQEFQQNAALFNIMNPRKSPGFLGAFGEQLVPSLAKGVGKWATSPAGMSAIGTGIGTMAGWPGAAVAGLGSGLGALGGAVSGALGTSREQPQEAEVNPYEGFNYTPFGENSWARKGLSGLSNYFTMI